MTRDTIAGFMVGIGAGMAVGYYLGPWAEHRRVPDRGNNDRTMRNGDAHTIGSTNNTGRSNKTQPLQPRTRKSFASA